MNLPVPPIAAVPGGNVGHDFILLTFRNFFNPLDILMPIAYRQKCIVSVTQRLSSGAKYSTLRIDHNIHQSVSIKNHHLLLPVILEKRAKSKLT